MKSIDHRALAQMLLPHVLQAGAVEMQYFRQNATVETKADASPVTAADREAEVVLLAALTQAMPQTPVIAEEAVSRGEVPAVGRAFFLVDPLDGTREFINGRSEFTVNVALIIDGRPVFGIVYAPALAELYVTLGPQKAAFAHIAPDASAAAIAACDFADMRTRPADPAALTAVASRSHLTAETETFLSGYRISERRNAGSSLKFGLLARGQADIYPRLGTTMEWDTAAGHAVLIAAGGAVTTLDGQPLVYGRKLDGFRNPHFVAWGTPDPIPASGQAPG